METMQDKLIREKLDSLQSLPEGYMPSLDSKWELLQTGKPEKKRTPLYFLLSAAASLLLLLGLGMVFWQTTQPKTQPLAHRDSAAVNQVATTRKTSKAQQKSTNFPGSHNAQIIASAEKKPENAMPVRAKTRNTRQAQAISLPEKMSAEKVTEAKPILVAEAISEPALLPAEQPASGPKKRNRYVEIDFDAPARPQQLPQPVQTAQLQVKVKFFPNYTTPDQQMVQQEKPLRLQHTF